ncbi:myb-like protein X [Stomoxys calcitrans]|uniref:myb-like protein X n=1 Tax=Stomoxys calcitrans TaxID=35570 RepID=UPI0027E2F8C6|nr:myb-like protein X [Stomoxys calcitrans]XP_013111266.2 myb-like protein X [Stomoxys calcitrans]
MMEVKQNTAVDLNDLLAPVKNTEATDEVDDVIMTDLTERAAHELNCDMIKTSEKSNNGLVTNGEETISSLIDLDSTNVALATPVPAELEDALLAEEDVLPKLTDAKVNSATSSSAAVDDILADKVETSNSTTSSNNVRDPGDDLDTLLSKINDIVDDCMDSEMAPVDNIPKTEDENTDLAPDSTNANQEPVDESVITLDDTVAEDSCIENDDISNQDEKGTVSEAAESLADDNNDVIRDVEINSSEQTDVESHRLDKMSENDLDDGNVIDQPTAIEANSDNEARESKTEKSVDEESTLAKVSSDNISKENIPKEFDSEDNSCLDDISKEPTPKDIPLEEGSMEESAKEQCTMDSNAAGANSENMNLDESEAVVEDERENIDDEKSQEQDIDEIKEDDAEIDQLNEDELLKDDDKMDDIDLHVDDKINDDQLLEDVATTNAKSDIEKGSKVPGLKEGIRLEEVAQENILKDDVGELEGKVPQSKDDKPEIEVSELNINEGEKETKDQDEVTEEDNQKQDKEETTTPIIESSNSASIPQFETEEKVEVQKQEKKIENEDSDDDIVFYVDKPPEAEKEKPSETSETNEKQAVEVENRKTKSADDDDIVILDDDDEVQTDKKPTSDTSQKEVTLSPAKTSNDNQTDKEVESEAEKKDAENDRKHSTIDMDNSDNARDDFVVSDKPSTAVDKKVEETEDNNSNCSSSSNLLLEAKQTENINDEPTQEDNDNDNDEDDDDGDVELIETESKEAELASEKGDESSDIIQPAKRPRLSEDSEMSSKTDEASKSRRTSESLEKKTDVTDSTTADSTTPNSLKRTHDVIELELDDEKSNDSSIESANKKARTEEGSATKEDSENKKPKEEMDSKIEAKKDIVKIVPSDIPIPLYPPPKLKNLSSHESIGLGFLKKFRKSFDKMTKQDLEELVLQKVVEAIIHRSEFAEMRELIEKQEKIITTHRTRISELSKQFRDLEMVHNRVVKDIEQRNSQFIMPVKITRAVGLQVYIPNKKTVMESPVSASSGPPASMPTVSPQRPTTSSQNNLTSPQRQYHSSTQATEVRNTQSNTVNTSAINSASLQRRGCAQKVTPIRPVPSTNSSTASATSSSSAASTQVYRNSPNQNQQISSQPRILNKNASNAPMGATSVSANASTMQRQRYMQSTPDSAQRLQHTQQNNVRPVNNTMSNQRVAPQQKLPTAPTAPQRRPDATTPTGSGGSTAALDNYMSTLSQLTGGNTAVSITPAKPKEKAVIDLTDEDETPSAPQQTNNAPAVQAQRRSLPVQSSNMNSTQQQYGRTAPPLTRIPPNSQMANTNKSRQMAMQGQKNSPYSSTINTPPGTSITRINVGANAQGPQRVKYSHPAPLPATPPQAFNPSWKLPPPRPTIRISNLDNGIVISWTMEEAMDRHAECVSYQIYAYQETSGPPLVDSWRHVGDVKAMLLPMAVTLTQFQEGQRYFFAVRAVDCHQRYGPFSLPKTWS